MDKKVQRALQQATARENEDFRKTLEEMTLDQKKELCQRLDAATAAVKARVLSS